MTGKEDLIAGILEIEWEMFQKVPNMGGRAVCQEDRKTFEIMRSSQAMSWSEETLESYLGDLAEAKENERNLLTEKYARMMESTMPWEYEKIEHLLPTPDHRVIPLIDQIVSIVLEWEDELARNYPYLIRRGRPIHSSEDTLYATSLETYLRGELATYSLRTIKLYHENVLKQKSEGINGSEVTLAHTTKRYGFKSLEDANEKIKSRGER